KGNRPSLALPYELRAEGQILENGNFQISMKAENQLFGSNAAGAPFTVYSPEPFMDKNGKKDICRNWSFCTKAGDEIKYEWPINAFENGNYHLNLHGPNGFYREFKGSAQGPIIVMEVVPEIKRVTKIPTGNLVISLTNKSNKPFTFKIIDRGYKKGELANSSLASHETKHLVVDLIESHGWYDFEISSTGNYLQRYAGRVETGKEGMTDPLINLS
ncbi:MAG: phospholipase domain-containing protein, partial [Sphingobacterium sp.]